MSGHSKWAGIKHKKAIVDAKRGQTFTRASREITIAAKEGGGDVEGNFRLRLAVQKAREVNMPADKIQAAIDRGTGAGKGESLEELRYEGYGPAGVAIMVDAVTDNRNRTAPAVRHVFSKHGGSLGETNSVAWMFERKGVITVQAGDKDPEEVGLGAIEAGLAATGGGVLDGADRVGACGTFKTSPGPAGPRLLHIVSELRSVLAAHAIAEAALEELFMGRNASSAIGVAQARGAILVALT